MSLEEIIIDSDFIVDGYAYLRREDNILCVNIETNHRTEFSHDYKMLSTTMDSIELCLAQEYLLRNRWVFENEEI